MKINKRWTLLCHNENKNQNKRGFKIYQKAHIEIQKKKLIDRLHNNRMKNLREK